MPSSAKPGVTPLTVAEIREEMWQEVARVHAGAPSQRDPEPAAARPRAQASVPIHSDGPLPLVALLGLDGEAFIAAACTTLLGRPARQADADAITAQMANGRSKVEVLGALQSSEEGRRSGRPIMGLRRRYLAQRSYRLPLVGPVARNVSSLLRHSGISRRLGGDRQPLAVMQAQMEARLSNLAAEMEQRQQRLEERMAAQQMANDVLTRRMAMMQAGHEAALRKAVDDRTRLAEQAATLGRKAVLPEEGVIDALLAAIAQLDGQGRRLAKVEATVDVAAASDQIEAAAGLLRAELHRRLVAAEAIAIQGRRELAEQQRHLAQMLGGLHAAPPGASVEDRGLDAFYVAFTDRFRGSRSDIKGRLRVYLPRLRAAQSGTAERPILDLGAGRGEFLELMVEERLVASGVDSNAAMAALCRRAGLECTECDALAYLAACPAGSLGAVTGFHIIEHVAFPYLVSLLDEARRALAPGGLLLLETPNPANILTASRYFYLDPTHRHPLPAEMMAMLVEARGFPQPNIMELHPMSDRFPGTDRALADALDRLFHGPQDYALVARKV